MSGCLGKLAGGGGNRRLGCRQEMVYGLWFGWINRARVVEKIGGAL